MQVLTERASPTFVRVLLGLRVLDIGLKLRTYVCTYTRGDVLRVSSHLFCALRCAQFTPQRTDYMKHLADVSGPRHRPYLIIQSLNSRIAGQSQHRVRKRKHSAGTASGSRQTHRRPAALRCPLLCMSPICRRTSRAGAGA